MQTKYAFRFKHVLCYARQKCQADLGEQCNNKIDF